MNYDTIEILYIDDSIDDANLVMCALKKCGLSNTIFHLNDGVEALDFLFCKGEFASCSIQTHLKLILLDLKMPKVSGFEVLEKIKTDSLYRTIPVVIFTSSEEASDIKQCYKYGANSYIVKPIESDSFFR